MREAVVGIDVGGTRIKATLVLADGTAVRDVVRPTPPDVADRLGAVAAELVEQLADDHEVVALGLAIPGMVDDERGVGVWSANLGWSHLDVRSAVGPHVSVPVAVGHDVRAGLLAEHRLGAARGIDDVLFVPIGTGIAGALISGGLVIAGSPWTGEIGHVVVVPDGPLCGCGRRGCLEAVSSAAAIGRRWRELSGSSGDAAQVALMVAAGDAVARRVWGEAIAALVSVVAPVVAAAGTRLLLVGGGLAQAGEVLLDPLRTTLATRLGGRDDVVVAGAALGDRAGSLGAALLALDLVAR
jgi:glucokinase